MGGLTPVGSEVRSLSPIGTGILTELWKDCLLYTSMGFRVLRLPRALVQDRVAEAVAQVAAALAESG